MKRLFAAVAVLAFAAGTASAQMTGSAHDFSGSTTWNTTGQICQVCHGVHSATNAGEGLMWNRAASGATYTMYGTTAAGTTPAATPGTESLVCLSCHDGTVALNQFGGNGTPPGGDIYVTGAALIGTSLANDHPVSITYTAGTASLVATTTEWAVGKPISDILFGVNQVECATCHDVHNEVPDNADADTKLLRLSNTGSAFCTTCHAK